MQDPAFRVGDRLDLGSIVVAQSFPDEIDIGAERGDPAVAGDVCSHGAATFWKTIEALVPPNPKEFDITQLSSASRASFATMFNCQAGSASL